MKKEQWKTVPEFNGRYEVSNFGRVRGWYYGGHKRKHPIIKTPQTNKNGYVYVVLWNGTRGKAFTIHRLVLSVFSNSNPASMDCCHKNHNRNDNRLSNLKWATRKENEYDKKLAGRTPVGENNGASKLSDKQVLKIRSLFDKGMSTNRIAKTLLMNQQNVWNICNRKTWKHL